MPYIYVYSPESKVNKATLIMVSNHRRSRDHSDTTSDEDLADMEYTPNNQHKKPGRKPTRTPRCFTKNALMARENRLKKKVYISTLETRVSSLKNENIKLSAIVENQSFLISDLKKEVKYLKSVISNSESIGKLIRAINLNSDISVTSSLNRSLENERLVNRSCTVTRPSAEPNTSQFVSDFQKKHPWEENDNPCINYPTPESNKSYYSPTEYDGLNNDDLLLDLDIPLEISNDHFLDMIDEKALESPMDDHTYHSTIKLEQPNINSDENDVGVCLHVSKNKVSLEFCPSCSDNASQSERLT